MGPQHLNFRGKASSKPLSLYDRGLVIALLCLITLGLIMVASSSVSIAQQQLNQPFYYLIRQLIFLVMACVIVLFLLRIEVQLWHKASFILFLIAVLLLIAVLIPGVGRMVNGSMRWIALGPIALQVSELAKFFTVLFVASFILRRHHEVQTRFSGFIKPMLALGLISLLLMLEPDFGATFVISLTVMIMLFLAGARLIQFVVLFLLMLAALATLAISSPYRLERLTTFLNPWAVQFDSGYQLTQSLIAFGRGGWLGTGLGESVQKLFYLPEAHTDFLFAVIAEELGLIGCVAVILLYGVLVARILLIARRTQLQANIFAAFATYGIGFALGLQVIINIGVSAGLLPTKGLTLPFMSYGGSSLVVSCMMMALVLRVDYESRCQFLGLRSGDCQSSNYSR